MSNVTIELKEDQAAFVLDKDWNLNFYTPKPAHEEEAVGSNVVYITMLSLLTIHDEAFVKGILEKFESWTDFYEKNR